MSKRKQHHPEFKAKVALEALKGEERGGSFRAPAHQLIMVILGLELLYLVSVQPATGWSLNTSMKRIMQEFGAASIPI